MLFKFLDKLRRKQKQLRPEEWDHLYVQVFGTDAGNLVLQDLMDRFGTFLTAEPGIDQPEYAAWYFEGRRSVVNWILDRLQVRDLSSLQEVAET